MNLFRDPYLWGSFSQGRWSGGWSIYNFVLVAPQNDGTNALSLSAETITPGTYRFSGNINSISTGGVRPVIGDGTLRAPITQQGPFEVDVVVTNVQSQLIGFKDYNDTDAQITGPISCRRVE